MTEEKLTSAAGKPGLVQRYTGSKPGLYEVVPRQVNSLQQRKAKKARVKAAQIIVKSLSPSQCRKMGLIANKTLGVKGSRRIRVRP